MRDGLVSTVYSFPTKVWEQNLKRPCTVRKTIEMATVDEFSQCVSYSLSCVGLPDVNSWLPFVSCTSERTFSCGFRPSSESPFATRCSRLCLTSDLVVSFAAWCQWNLLKLSLASSRSLCSLLSMDSAFARPSDK